MYGGGEIVGGGALGGAAVLPMTGGPDGLLLASVALVAIGAAFLVGNWKARHNG